MNYIFEQEEITKNNNRSFRNSKTVWIPISPNNDKFIQLVKHPASRMIPHIVKCVPDDAIHIYGSSFDLLEIEGRIRLFYKDRYYVVKSFANLVKYLNTWGDITFDVSLHSLSYNPDYLGNVKED